MFIILLIFYLLLLIIIINDNDDMKNKTSNINYFQFDYIILYECLCVFKINIQS